MMPSLEIGYANWSIKGHHTGCLLKVGLDTYHFNLPMACQSPIQMPHGHDFFLVVSLVDKSINEMVKKKLIIHVGTLTWYSHVTALFLLNKFSALVSILEYNIQNILHEDSQYVHLISDQVDIIDSQHFYKCFCSGYCLRKIDIHQNDFWNLWGTAHVKLIVCKDCIT